MSDESRSDAAVRHFQARATQPKTLAGNRGDPRTVTPVEIRIAFDHPAFDCGRLSMSDQIDASRWNYVGVSQLPRSCTSAKRIGYASMCSGFEY